MSVTSDEHTVEVGGSTVVVTGRTGVVHATWTLTIDGVEADQRTATGDVPLRGALPDGSEVVAEVHQSAVGPTEVVVLHAGTEVDRRRGFVA